MGRLDRPGADEGAALDREAQGLDAASRSVQDGTGPRRRHRPAVLVGPQLQPGHAALLDQQPLDSGPAVGYQAATVSGLRRRTRGTLALVGGAPLVRAMVVAVGVVMSCFVVIMSGFGVAMPGFTVVVPGIGMVMPGFVLVMPCLVVVMPGFVVVMPGFVLAMPCLVVLMPAFVVVVPGAVTMTRLGSGRGPIHLQDRHRTGATQGEHHHHRQHLLSAQAFEQT